LFEQEDEEDKGYESGDDEFEKERTYRKRVEEEQCSS
jgi:hypothetical protein